VARRDTSVYWWLGAVALLILGTGGVVTYKATRGIRNNNPGNIRKSGAKWQGMRDVQDDPDFVQFIAPEWGIRALARTLSTYYNTHGLRTVRAIISRWAPPNENNTDAYVRAVSSAVGKSADAPLALSTDLPALVKAIIRHENGINPYSDDTIAKGIALA
jgi:hypothetical protein